MYYLIGWHKKIRFEDASKVISIEANQEQELILILTNESIHIWNPRPAIEIVSHHRSAESISSIGSNRSAVWKSDSELIVVATDRDQLIFYRLSRRESPNSDYLLTKSSPGELISSRIIATPGQAVRADVTIPALTVFSFGKLDLSSIGVSCLMSAEEELIIGARNGDIYGINWDGNIDVNFPWSLSKDVPRGSDYACDLKFSSVLTGFVIVFYSGKVGFLPLKGGPEDQEEDYVDGETKQEPRSSRLNYLNGVHDATCAEINHKYRLVAIGLKSSKVILCTIGESKSGLEINQTVQLDQSKFPQEVQSSSSVKCIRYSPDSFAMTVCWTERHFAVWSVFGSILFCSIQWQLDQQVDQLTHPIRVSCFAWGREGYSLWLRIRRDGSGVNESIDHEDQEEILIISIAHSNLYSNPHSTCGSDSIVLMSEERIYIGPSVPQEDKFDDWFIIDVPNSYLSSNYPVRYASVDRECKMLALAGNRGFLIHRLGENKWESTSKKSHQDNFTICADLIWWGEYLVTACLNLDTETFEIRAYLISGKLNKESYVSQTTAMEVIKMSLFENRLLVLYSNGTMAMFMLNIRMRIPNNLNQNELAIEISPIESLVVSNLQANAHCISSIALTRLHSKNDRSDDSILLNICGKLLLLERELTNTLSDVTFKAVSVIATNVEQFWISPEISHATELSYFKKSLWLYRGGSTHHLQVWLPLLNDNNDPPKNLYVPDRLMLPIKCDIYPLAIRSSSPNVIQPDDAIVLGAESDILYRDHELFNVFPYFTVKRQCRVYLHRILRELLLNQHLGYYARKVAEACQTLPYFAHCFELLLHEVLEEEATSAVPVPDPMLPQVVKFIKEFPVYLETVVHCARKSELSMWSYLFDEKAVGNPRRLFQECIDKHKLDTAASCLIILDNLDRNIVSQKMVKDLIKAAKDDPKFTHLIEDLESFIERLACANQV